MRIKKIHLLCIVCGFTLIACNNDEAEKTDFLKKGIELFEEGRYAESKLEIKNSIQQHPYLAEAHYYLALLNEKNRKYDAMKGNLIEAIKLNPHYQDARIKLSKIYLLSNQLEKALTEVDVILSETPENPDALLIKAAIFFRQNNPANALAIVDKVLQKNVNNIEAISLKTAYLIKEKLYDDASDLLSSAIEKNKKNSDLYMLKARLDSRRNDSIAEIEDYKNLAQLKPDDIQIQFLLARSYQKANKTYRAESILKSVVKNHPTVLNAKLVLLDFLFLNNAQEADYQLDSYIKQYKNNHSELIEFSKWLIGRGNTEKAGEILNFVLTQKNIEKDAEELAQINLAVIDIIHQRYNHGLSYLDRVLKNNPRNLIAELLKAEILIATENYSDASKALENILWQKPNMDKALSLLGTINVIQGDRVEATHNYFDAIKVNSGNLVALDFVIDNMLEQGYIDDAVHYLEEALLVLPDQLSILTKLIELNINASNWNVSHQYIEKLYHLNNGKQLSRYFTGRILQKQNNCNNAIVIYEEILEDNPGLKNALFAMAECYFAINKQQSMMKYLAHFIEKHPELIFPYVLNSQLLSVEKKYSKAIVLLNSILKNNKINHASLYIELARVYSALENKDKEYGMYTEGLKHYPNNISLLLLLATFYEDTGEFDKAVELNKKVLIVNPRNNIAKNNLATLLLDHYGKSEDIAESVRLTTVFKQSKQPYFLDTYGWAQFKNGNVDKALSIFRQVIILEPDVPIFRYHLAVALYEVGDVMNSASELKQALHLMKGKIFPERAIIKKMLAKIEQ